MKYLLVPFTAIACFFITYLGLFYGTQLFLWMFNLNWFWFLVGFTFIIGIISSISVELPNLLLSFILLKFYKSKSTVNVIHAIASAIGIILYVKMIFFDSAVILDNYENVSLLMGMWKASWLKSILLLFPFIGLVLGSINFVVLALTNFKVNDRNEYY